MPIVSFMRFNAFGIVTLMISAIFIWIYVINSVWGMAKDLVAFVM